jgi:hypothetical protein
MCTLTETWRSERPLRTSEISQVELTTAEYHELTICQNMNKSNFFLIMVISHTTHKTPPKKTIASSDRKWRCTSLWYRKSTDHACAIPIIGGQHNRHDVTRALLLPSIFSQDNYIQNCQGQASTTQSVKRYATIPLPFSPQQSPVKLEHIISKPKYNSSVNITNMVQVLCCGFMFYSFNADTG